MCQTFFFFKKIAAAVVNALKNARFCGIIATIKYCCLIMSDNYIKNHFTDIKKHASDVENRIDDDWCTMQSLLADNARMLELAQKYKVNYLLIDDKYKIDINL